MIEEKKYDVKLLLFKRKRNRKPKLKNMERTSPEAGINLLKGSKDISQNNEYMLNKLSLGKRLLLVFKDILGKLKKPTNLFELQ